MLWTKKRKHYCGNQKRCGLAENCCVKSSSVSFKRLCAWQKNRQGRGQRLVERQGGLSSEAFCGVICHGQFVLPLAPHVCAFRISRALPEANDSIAFCDL